MPLDARTSLRESPKADTAKPSPWIAWSPLFFVSSAVIFSRSSMPAWVFMWLLAAAIFFGLKWATWIRAQTTVPHPAWRSVAYLLAWPGMDAESFLDTSHAPPKPNPHQWIQAALETGLGVGLIWGVARHVPPSWILVQGWVGMLGLIFLLHFGSFQLDALFWQSRGVTATPIMSAPILSRSLSEFWGKRWNLGFRQLAHELVFLPLRRHIGAAAAGFAVFVVSGLIHELVISLPARGGYGLPTSYFILQGIGVRLERSSTGERLGLRDGWRAWCFMAAFTAAPAFWLFHPPFVTRVIVPFLRAVKAL